MKLLGVLLLAFLASAPLLAVEPDEVPAPAAAEAPVQSQPDRSGALLEMGLTQYLFANGTPLAFRFGGGYEFPSGLRLTTALDTLYYAGIENGQKYSYQLNNWILQAIYHYPLAWHLRAQGGANVDFFFGSRSLENVPNAHADGVNGFIGLGLLGGLALDLTQHWELALQARYTETFTDFASFPAVDLTAVYTW